MADEANVAASVVRSSRDDDALRDRLQAWLSNELPTDSKPRVSEVTSPASSGMSSETLLFDAHWRDSETGEEVGGSFVGRMAPSQEDHPTFPRYDLALQAQVMRMAVRNGVPAPNVRWLELDAKPLGAPFLVMERIEGRVPADIPTYVTEGWVFDASAEERRHLQESTVAAIAKIHAIPTDKEDVAFLEYDAPGESPLARHVADQRAYYEWAVPDRPSPLIERAFEHLQSTWPEETSRVVSWGDSRIGNVMYKGFEPAAILDWEMAGIGPREMDLGWLAFMHHFFQDLFERMGLPGLPDFLRIGDLASTYAKQTGYVCQNLDWYMTYGALRHAIIMSRISDRSVHFGEAEPPADPDDRIPHRATLEGMIEGTFFAG